MFLSPARRCLAADPPAATGRTSLKRFPANLGRSFVGLFAAGNVKPFLIGSALTGASLPLDGPTQRFFERQRWDAFGSAGNVAGGTPVIASTVGGLFVVGRFVGDQRFRNMSYALGEAAVLNGLLTTGLKYAVRRERPDRSNNLSFPSGHTSDSFTLAAVLAHSYGPRAAIPAYTIAGLIGVSRMARDVHHLSDVLAGATLGLLVGRSAAAAIEGPDPRTGRHDPALVLSPVRGGVQLRLLF